MSASDMLARLTGRLDAAIDHPDWCPITPKEIQDEIMAIRRRLYEERWGVPPSEEYR